MAVRRKIAIHGGVYMFRLSRDERAHLNLTDQGFVNLKYSEGMIIILAHKTDEAKAWVEQRVKEIDGGGE